MKHAGHHLVWLLSVRKRAKSSSKTGSVLIALTHDINPMCESYEEHDKKDKNYSSYSALQFHRLSWLVIATDSSSVTSPTSVTILWANLLLLKALTVHSWAAPVCLLLYVWYTCVAALLQCTSLCYFANHPYFSDQSLLNIPFLWLSWQKGAPYTFTGCMRHLIPWINTMRHSCDTIRCRYGIFISFGSNLDAESQNRHTVETQYLPSFNYTSSLNIHEWVELR